MKKSTFSNIKRTTSRAESVKVFFRGLSVKSILSYRRRNKRLRETVVSMLSCGALERSNNPYIESTVEPCVPKNQKGIFTV